MSIHVKSEPRASPTNSGRKMTTTPVVPGSLVSQPCGSHMVTSQTSPGPASMMVSANRNSSRPARIIPTSTPICMWISSGREASNPVAVAHTGFSAVR